MAFTQTLTVGGAAALLHTPVWKPSGTGLRGIIILHGHGGNDLQAQQGFAFGNHPEQLADKGYAVLAVSTGDTWLAASAMTVITAGYTYLTGTVGVTGSKVAMVGWSLGGGHVLRWITENPTKVNAAVLFSPLSDLDWAEQQAGWQSEIQALYGGSHTTYLAQGSPRSPMNNLASYRSTAKILIVHPTDDGTVPYSQSTGFIAAVKDPGVTLRSPDVTGGHSGGQLAVLPRESWEFIRTRWS